MDREAETVRRGAADWLVLVGRFAALVYLNILVWLSVWVLIPTLFMGLRPMAIDSGSMGPAIRAGDVILVQDPTGEPIEPGRVVTFRDPADPERLVTHRITGANRDGTYRTKGDANSEADSTPLTEGQIDGVGRLVVPRAGMPVVWLGQRNYAALGAWAVSVMLALVLLAPSKPAGTAAEAPRARRRSFRRADTTTSPPSPLAVVPVASSPLPPAAAPVSAGFALPAPPPAPFALVPAVRYRIRLPQPPAALELPAPPRWSVSLVPPAPGTAPVAPIPAPPRPASVRRGTALSTRQVPGWTGRLHAVLLILALTAGLSLAGAASAPPASAAFSSTHHSVVNNTGNSFSAHQLNAPWNPAINAPLAACRLQISWSSSSSNWRTGYRVYRSVNGGAYTAIGTSAYDAISYTDNTATSPSTTYSYKVVAYLTGTWESAATTPVSGSPSLAACAT